MLQSNGMTSGPRGPGSAWVKGGRGGSKQCRTDRDLWGPGDDTSPPRRTRAPFSPGCRLPAAADSGENRGTSPSHSLPQPHPLPEGGSKVLAVATAAPCPAARGPTTPTANGLGVSSTRCAEPAAPAGWGRYPESLCQPRRRRTRRVSPGRAAGGRRKKTDSTSHVTSGLEGGAAGGGSRGLGVGVGFGLLTCLKLLTNPFSGADLLSLALRVMSY